MSIETNKKQIATQQRWVDELVVGTRPIGPVVAPASPEIRVAGAKRWALVIQDQATDEAYGDHGEGESIRLDFKLPSGSYKCAIRRDGEKMLSPFHQPFRVL